MTYAPRCVYILRVWRGKYAKYAKSTNRNGARKLRGRKKDVLLENELFVCYQKNLRSSATLAGRKAGRCLSGQGFEPEISSYFSVQSSTLDHVVNEGS